LVLILPYGVVERGPAVKTTIEKQTNPWKATFLIAISLLSLASSGLAQSSPEFVAKSRPRRVVLVSLADRKLAVIENGNVLACFSVAVGAAVSPSPTGEFEIVNRVANPTYYHDGIVMGPGKDNPVGTRWMGLNVKGYGIHGTNAPRSVGHATSHGCIRLRNRDVERLYAMLRVGDVVEIRAERDEEIAAVFGGADEKASQNLATNVGQ
jgi:lipoprotein-anchoring transpeptidase ErfK/SrfK